MRLLLDNNLSPQLVDLLAVQGHEVEHVRDHGLQAATDSEVMELARVRSLVLVSADTDFGRLLQLSQASGPSIVLPEAGVRPRRPSCSSTTFRRLRTS